MSQKINKRELKKYLGHLSKEDLEKEVLKLFSIFKEVKSYYQLELGSEADRVELLNAYKERITLKYFPKRGFGDPSNSEIRKIIEDYKNIAIFKHEVAALLLHRISCVATHSTKYAYYEEAMYNSVYSNFEELLDLMETHKLTDLFLEDCEAIVAKWVYGEDMRMVLKQRFKKL